LWRHGCLSINVFLDFFLILKRSSSKEFKGAAGGVGGEKVGSKLRGLPRVFIEGFKGCSKVVQRFAFNGCFPDVRDLNYSRGLHCTRIKIGEKL